MNTLTYNCLGDSRTYVMTCNDEQLGLYIDLLFENGAYKVILNNKLEYTEFENDTYKVTEKGVYKGKYKIKPIK